jgi:hypothetical protein
MQLASHQDDTRTSRTHSGFLTGRSQRSREDSSRAGEDNRTLFQLLADAGVAGPSATPEGSQAKRTLSSGAAQDPSSTEGTQHASAAAAAQLGLRVAPQCDPLAVIAKRDPSSSAGLAGSQEGTVHCRGRNASSGVSAESLPSGGGSLDNSVHRRSTAMMPLMQQASMAGSLLASLSRQQSTSPALDTSNRSGSMLRVNSQGRLSRADTSMEMTHHLRLYSEILFFSGMNDLAQVQRLLSQVWTCT